MAEPTHDEHLTQIRDRSRRLAEIPLETSASNYIMRDMIDSIGDVRWLLEQLEQLTPAGYEYRANGDYIHEISEEHASTYPEGWTNGYWPERRQLYAGDWQRADTDDTEQQPEDGDRLKRRLVGGWRDAE